MPPLGFPINWHKNWSAMYLIVTALQVQTHFWCQNSGVVTNAHYCPETGRHGKKGFFVVLDRCAMEDDISRENGAMCFMLWGTANSVGQEMREGRGNWLEEGEGGKSQIKSTMNFMGKSLANYIYKRQDILPSSSDIQLKSFQRAIDAEIALLPK